MIYVYFLYRSIQYIFNIYFYSVFMPSPSHMFPQVAPSVAWHRWTSARAPSTGDIAAGHVALGDGRGARWIGSAVSRRPWRDVNQKLLEFLG